MRLVDRAQGVFPGANTFTVIVGKNGTGKSRFLRAMALGFMAEQAVQPTVADKDLDRQFETVLSMGWSEQPSRLIGLSTSPFDKFPLLRSSPQDYGYTYLGLRGLPSANLGVAYLGRIIGNLLDSVTARRETATAIAHVLDYLGYAPRIDIVLQLVPDRVFESITSGEAHTRLPNIEGLQVERNFASLSPRDRSLALKTYQAYRDIAMPRRRRVHMSITPDGVMGDMFTPDGGIFTLLRVGLLKLAAVSLHKRGESDPFQVHSASSGEQAVVMSLLGIASQIQDGAVVLIDEPEICLHPEWQERYIHLLFDAFSQYRRCHFIIATHSPQVIAELPPGNCYVLSMEDLKLQKARAFSKRSVDFQLASLFNAPGFKNEYLLRSALGIFADITKGRELDAEGMAAIKTFGRVFEHLQDDDPVKELISVIFEARKRDA